MPMSRRDLTRALTVTVGSATLLGTTELTTASAAQRTHKRTTTATRSHDRSTRYPPLITHTHHRPTGYEVTFRYHAPDATRVQLKGEWYFGNPYELSSLAGTQDSVVATPGTTPAHWRPGDIPLPYPNSNVANWPVVDMRKGRDGVWSYTTPLPSGTFSYGFFVDLGPDDGGVEVYDPSNPPWNAESGIGSVEPVSQVYVPSDDAFRTEDLSWQAPSDRPGSLVEVTYDAPTSLTPAGSNYAGVYTPPNYNRHRATPYPTVYMLAPDNEVAWGSQGALPNILDNLINSGAIQPMVVVTPNVQGFPDSTDSAPVAENLLTALMPYVESRYHVSTAASRRAVAGLGYGASVANALLFGHTDEFGSFGVFSPGIKGPYTLPTTLSSDQVGALREANILVGGGLQDPSHYYHASEVALLTSAGIPVMPNFVNGGHNWYSWRFNAKEFLSRVAFFPPFAG
ncbi:MAG: alpha/beta hydrolase-fold protein [Nocardioides sp.]|uniref:alpha/beta hydrolase-fold protein n=1 Tax=Nocardioides sp. TaxID=35761 RepID=UPI0039E54459